MVSRDHSIPDSPILAPCSCQGHRGLRVVCGGQGGAGDEAPTGRTGGRRSHGAPGSTVPTSTVSHACRGWQRCLAGPEQRRGGLCPTAPGTMCLGPFLLVWGQPPLLPAPHPTLHPAPHPAPLRSALPLCTAEQAAANLPRSSSTAAQAGCHPATAYGTAASLCRQALGSHRDRPPPQQSRIRGIRPQACAHGPPCPHGGPPCPCGGLAALMPPGPCHHHHSLRHGSLVGTKNACGGF